MKEVVGTMTSKGQVTIPALVRKHLGLGPKDKISFLLEDNGTVRIRAPRYPDIDSLRGMAGTLPKPLSWHEIREIAREDHLRHKVVEER